MSKGDLGEFIFKLKFLKAMLPRMSPDDANLFLKVYTALVLSNPPITEEEVGKIEELYGRFHATTIP
jgi:hypothetical protein